MSSEAAHDPASPPAPVEHELQRILAAVEKDRRKRWVEIVCAIVLSMTTMASAWCAYQSKLWSGVQTRHLGAAGAAGRESAAERLEATLHRAFDASMFITLIQARSTKDKQLEDFLSARFRPEMKVALDAWLKTDPFNNPTAPPSPFHMAEYVQKELELAAREHQKVIEAHDAAQRAGNNSNTYVLLTVMFASVLFFGGMANTFEARRVRMVIAIMALMLFIGTVIVLSTMPVATY